MSLATSVQSTSQCPHSTQFDLSLKASRPPKHQVGVFPLVSDLITRPMLLHHLAHWLDLQLGRCLSSAKPFLGHSPTICGVAQLHCYLKMTVPHSRPSLSPKVPRR